MDAKDELVSTFAFIFNLRRYSKDPTAAIAAAVARLKVGAPRTVPAGRRPAWKLFCTMGLHSSTSRLNVSAFCGTRGACRGCIAVV